MATEPEVTLEDRAVHALEVLAAEVGALRKILAAVVIGSRKMKAEGSGTVRQADGTVRDPASDKRKGDCGGCS